MYLEKIDDPKDLKHLSINELHSLSDELRSTLLNKLSIKGGHNGPNLGVVELTVALHKVFDSPVDKLIFDVSHQTYIHKMLTGRREAFMNEDSFDDVTGYTDPTESAHDFFTIGHTSTSVSLAYGMAKARDLRGDHENIIAIIGDGSLSGGEAFEGLNNAGELDSNLIIVINDNNQSIAENHGGIYKNLKDLRDGNGVAETNFFTSMGLDYLYVDDGHNLKSLIDAFSKAKDHPTPIVVHVRTIKGKGFKPAEENREKFHAGGPINLETGEYKFVKNDATYTSETRDFLTSMMKKDHRVSVITAGTPVVPGFTKELREEFKEQFIDVGIAEEHAVAMSSAMAKSKTKPIFTVHSTFLQRAYDQISHDLAINSNPATILVYGGSVHGMNDVTHLGFYDIPMISNIPNMVYLAPTNLEEHLAMLEYAVNQTKHPVAIKVPFGNLVRTGIRDTTDYSKLNKFQVTNEGSKVVLIGAGNFYHLSNSVANELRETHNINPTVINPRFLTGLDKDLLDSLVESHDLIVTMEDGQLQGGFGSNLAAYMADKDIRIKPLGIEKQFIDKFDADDLLRENGLTIEQIVDYITNNI